ncbi:acetylcholine receptor subunit alpha-like 1 [Mya arenaria]|uniref:acetylcholine receptor subunit alpha-like 1 n=1 Tax=Mya arenaria TaxID=6604 RepID=UPI0022E3B9A8|nr:acetylcholine receptor subunit alpha-like 1 [Mya arenaria]
MCNLFGYSDGNDDAKRLYHDLLIQNKYNKLIRPIGNNTNKPLMVRMGIRLSQIIDVDELNQVMTTNVWLRQEWYDFKLTWHPVEYGGVDRLYVPSELIWLPDIVLYNNADGDFEVQLLTKATVMYTGLIIWEPPAIYKSACIMDVEFFPFDVQNCSLKFGSWTYDGFEIDLVHVCANDSDSTEVIVNGIDLSEFYQSVEWDVISVTAKKNIKRYICCLEPYIDVTFHVTMRRKTLFHTVTLILPCAVISFLTVLVFYLPSDSEEKITLCISVLLSLTVFFLLLTEIIPPSSVVIPLIGKYLLFTMILVTLSIIVTVCILTIHFRSPATHNMSHWTQTVFLHILPKMLCMKRPIMRKYRLMKCNGVKQRNRKLEPSFIRCDERHVTSQPREGLHLLEEDQQCRNCQRGSAVNRRVEVAFTDVKYISDHLKEEDEYSSNIEDWKFVAMVLDRMFFWIFTSASIIGTFGILLQAPTLYDDRSALSAETFKWGYC